MTAEVQTSASLVTAAITTATRIPGLGLRGAIKGVRIRRTSGTGTQFKICYYMGYSGSGTHRLITSVSAPYVANDFPIATQFVAIADPPAPWNYAVTSGPMWSGGVQKSAVGVYYTCQEIAPATTASYVVLTHLICRDG